MGLASYLDLGLYIVGFSAFGIVVNTNSVLITVMCIELMFYGLNFLLTTASIYLDDILGEVISFFVVTLAASESALALALITAFFKIAAGSLVIYIPII